VSPFEIPTVVVLKSQILRYFTTYQMVNNYMYVERSYWFHQNDVEGQEEGLDCLVTKTEPTRCVETSVNIYQLTRRITSEKISTWIKFIKV